VTTSEALIEIASAAKPGQLLGSESDLSLTLDGVAIDLVRQYDSLAVANEGSFGTGWRLALRDVDLQTDVPLTGRESAGVANAFSVGTRVYLSLPSGERVGFSFTPQKHETPGLTVYTPAFTADAGTGWTLSAVDRQLTLAGNRLFDLASGLAYNPTLPAGGEAQLILTGPDGTAYEIDAARGVTAIVSASGKRLVVSDSGIVAPNGEAIRFTTDAAGRIAGISAPNGERIVYGYDGEGRLSSVRRIADSESTHYGYEVAASARLAIVTGANDLAIDYSGATPAVRALAGDLGAARSYLAAPFAGNLAAGEDDRLAFAVRPSEFASTASGTIYLGVIVEAAAGSALLPAIPMIDGLTPIASSAAGGQAFALYALSWDASALPGDVLHLLRVAGADATTAGDYSLQIFIAGDANADTQVDGSDAQIVTAARGTRAGDAGYVAAADANRDGVIDAADSQLLFQNIGYLPNRPPVIAPQMIKTHQDLEVTASLATMASDPDGDPVFYRLDDSTFGVAHLGSDGRSLSFVPEAGYTGSASFDLVGDDGYSQSPVGSISVNVSDAKLLRLSWERLSLLEKGTSERLQVLGDFEDEAAVTLPASYLTFVSTAPDIARLSADGTVFGLAEGTAVLKVASHGIQAVNAISVFALPELSPEEEAEYDFEPPFFSLDVYPDTLTLLPNAVGRQFHVTAPDGSDVTEGASGVLYFVSNPAVASVSAEGFVTGLNPGVAALSIVYAGSQQDVPLSVQAPTLGRTVVGPTGGAVQDASGVTVTIGPDTLARETAVSIDSLALAALPLSVPDTFQFAGAFELDIGQGEVDQPVQIALPVPAGILAGSHVYFYRHVTLPDEAGQQTSMWLFIETGLVGSDGMARTASPPAPGVRAGGTYLALVNTAASVVNLAGDALSPAFSAVAMLPGLGPTMGVVLSPFGPVPLPVPTAGLLNNLLLRIYSPNGVSTTPAPVAPSGTASSLYTVTVTPPAITALDTPEVVTLSPDISVGKATLKIEGNHFQVTSNQTTTEELTVVFRIGDKEVVADPKNVTFVAGALSTLEVDVPEGVIVGIADIQLRRTKTTMLLGSSGLSTPSTESVDGNSVRVSAGGGLVFVGVHPNKVVMLDGSTTDPVATVELPGAALSSTAPLAATPDQSRLYVGLRTGGIAVVDVVGQREGDADLARPGLDRISKTENGLDDLPGIHGLVSDPSGAFLYAVGNGRGASNVIYVVDIRPFSKDFHKVVSRIDVPVNDAPMGLLGMDISADGRRLYAAAPKTTLTDGPGGRSWYDGNPQNGNIVVINVDGNDEPLDSSAGNSRRWREVIRVLEAGYNPHFVVASSDPHKIAFSNFLDMNHGFATLQVTKDDPNDFQATIRSVSLNLPVDLKFNLDIQNARGIAITPDLKYAFVTDWFVFDFPHRRLFRVTDPQDYAILEGRGAKIGVIEDPFGPGAKLVGSTTPVLSGFADRMALSPDGRYLYADFRGSGGALSPPQVKVFDVEAIRDTLETGTPSEIAARRAEMQKRPIEEVNPAVQVKPLDLGGMPVNTATFVSPNFLFDDIVISAKFGDIIKVDIEKELTKLHYVFTPSADSPFYVPIVGWNGLPGKVAHVMYPGESKIVQADDAVDVPSATRFEDTGVFYFVPDLDSNHIQRLRRTETSLDAGTSWTSYTITLADGAVVAGQIRIELSDRPSATDNVGFTELMLDGPVGNLPGRPDANRPLDVFKVQQRLKYLGFRGWGSQYVYAANTVYNPNQLKILPEAAGDDNELDVDGRIEVAANQTVAGQNLWIYGETIEAIKLFQTTIQDNAVAPDPNGVGARRTLPFTPTNQSQTTPAKFIEATGIVASGSNTLDWMNALNAPRWVELVDVTPRRLQNGEESVVFSQWVNHYQVSDFDIKPENDGSGRQEERFGTNWAVGVITRGAANRGDNLSTPLYIEGDNYGQIVNAVSDLYSDTRSTVHLGHGSGLEFDIYPLHPLSAGGNWAVLGSAPANNILDPAPPVGVTLDPYQKRAWYLNDAPPTDLGVFGVTVAANDPQRLNNYEREAVRNILQFVDAAQERGMFHSVVFGESTGSYQYLRIEHVLNELDVTHIRATTHKNHFHIRLQPPPMQIAPLMKDDSVRSTPAVADDFAGAADLPALLLRAEALWPEGHGSSTAGGDKHPIQATALQLPTGMIGATDGASVQFDTDADGVGWFVDRTPWENEEFYWDEARREWVAVVGGPAEGKIDLLSVLTHEIGHVVGLVHTQSAGKAVSVMATPLASGVRRFPTEQDLTALAALRRAVPDDVSSPSVIAGPGILQPAASTLETRNVLGSRGKALLVSPSSVLLPGLLNGGFTVDDALAPGFGWTMAGAVTVEHAALVLREGMAQLSRASQSFMIPVGAESLRFSLHPSTLGASSNSPPDAFEVALLSAETLAPISGTVGLAGSDALLNVQADGRLRSGNRVLLDGQPPGAVLAQDPVTVDIDLTGIATDKPIRLYFDLLGFGAADSEVIIDDVEFVMPPNTAPLAVSDLITVDEDSGIRFDVRLNDSDAQGDPLTVEVLAGPQQGTLIAEADGSFSYRPAADFHGEDLFTYRLNDGSLNSAAATVGLVVRAVNDAPTALGDSATLAEDSVLDVDVLANDSDPDGNALRISTASAPAHGRVTILTDGRVRYTPNTDYFGPDRFTYTASDSLGGLAVAEVLLTVTPVADAPRALDDLVQLDEDGSAQFDVRSNDVDPDGDTLILERLSDPQHGSLEQRADGSFVYLPQTDFSGDDSFSYRLGDGALWSSVATVTLQVAATNDAPSVTTQQFATPTNTVLLAALHASDPEGDPLSFSLEQAPLHGALQLGPDGSFRFTPQAGFVGADSWLFRVSDGQAVVTARAEIRVSGVNHAPIAADDAIQVDENSATQFDILANDSDADADPLTIELLSMPVHGVLTALDGGGFEYLPDNGFNGEDHFSYRLGDGQSWSTPATVRLDVQAVNYPPVAADDAATLAEDSALEIDVLANDSDPDGDALTVVAVGTPQNGQVQVLGDGRVRYTPRADFFGSDSFSYTIADPAGVRSPATVRIEVTPVADLPSTSTQRFVSLEDVTLEQRLSATNRDGDSLSFAVAQTVAHGQLTLANDGTFQYVPDAGFSGSDGFGFTVSNGAGKAAGVVELTITPVNDAPVAQGARFEVDEDDSIGGTIAANATDEEGDPIGFELVSGPVHGDFIFHADGSFSYQPFADFNGDDRFTYAASDGVLKSPRAVVHLVVRPANDPPAAFDDSRALFMNETVDLDVLANDQDIDGDTLTVVRLDTPAHGQVSVLADGRVRYVPDLNYYGQDRFGYVLADAAGIEAQAEVLLEIQRINTAPRVSVQSFQTAESISLTTQLVASDHEGDALGFTLTQGPAHGALTLDFDGRFIYVPQALYHGSDSFTFSVTDGLLSSSARAEITVTPVNDAPQAVDDTAELAEDGFVLLDVRANDRDPDGDPLTLTDVSLPAHGRATIESGRIRYTPDANYFGPDSLVYTVSDGQAVATATVTIKVNTANDWPTATKDGATVDEDSSLLIDVLANDSDIEGDPLRLVSVTIPAHGQAVIENGAVRYTPAANFFGRDTFTYTVTDNKDKSTAIVTVDVLPIDDAPVARDDSRTTNEDQSVLISVLANDSDYDAVGMVIDSLTDAAHGALTVQGSAVRYTPDANYHGADSFGYTLRDGKGRTASASVALTVTPVADAPIVIAQQFNTIEDQPLSAQLVASDADGDVLTFALNQAPAHGQLTLAADGSFTYQPATNHVGRDSFVFRVSDGVTVVPATVEIVIAPANDDPVAVDDVVPLEQDGSVPFDVRSNDSDADGDALTVDLVSTPASGQLLAQADGSFVYTPVAGFSGEDRFTYRLSDGQAFSAVATVRLLVAAVNHPPVAEDDSAATDEDTPVTIAVLANDHDPDGDALAVALLAAPQHGSAVANADGSITYAPAADFFGTDHFSYTLSDGRGRQDVATVHVNITALNDRPLAMDDRGELAEDGTLLIDVRGNDGDADGDSLVVTAVSAPANGSATIENGFIRYTPAPDFFGSDRFTYTIIDGQESSSAEVTITVRAVDDDPVAHDDQATTDEDQSLRIDVLANDSDRDRLGLTIDSLTAAMHGTVVVDGSAVRYTPAANHHGTDTFAYTLRDGKGRTASATVAISITPVADSPVVAVQQFNTAEDTPLGDQLVASDADGDVLAFVLDQAPLHGQLSLAVDGSFTYQPDADYAGPDSFVFSVGDGQATSSAQALLMVAAINDPPRLGDDAAEVDEDGFVLIDVRANDQDVEGDALTLIGFSDAQHGKVTIDNTGFRYIPDADFSGTERFTYTLGDGQATATATVHITVKPVNDWPAAVKDEATVDEDSSILIDVLANDTDAEGDRLQLVSVWLPAHGTAVIENGAIRYTPAANFFGRESFAYTVSDGTGSSTSIVSVEVLPIDDAPVANGDSATTNEDKSVLIDVLANDSDVDAVGLAIESLVAPAHGTLAIEGAAVRYTPAADHDGADSFSYTLRDGRGRLATASVAISINPVDDAPMVMPQQFSGLEDTVLVGAVVAHDADGDVLHFVLDQAPLHGQLTLGVDGQFQFRPDAEFAGTDHFSFLVSDGANSVPAQATISIAAVNDAPLARDDVVQLLQGSSVSFDVRANDSDADGDAMTVELLTGPTHGALVALADGSFIYTPAVGFSGEDALQYRLSDGVLHSAPASVRLLVEASNRSPLAAADQAYTDEDRPITIDVLANDSDPDQDLLSVLSVTAPQHGSAVLNANGSVTYTPLADYVGNDHFSYTISDGHGGEEVGHVTVTMAPINDLPQAVDDAAAVAEDGSVLIDVRANDSDNDGDLLVLTAVSVPAHGTAIIEGGAIRYTPSGDFFGNDHFSYTVSDGQGSSRATVTVGVQPVDDAPRAQDDQATTNEDQSVLIAVLANDSDFDAAGLAIDSVSPATHGTVAIVGDSVRYTPAADHHGADSFSYTLRDGKGRVASASVAISITAVNDAPVARDDVVQLLQGNSASFDVRANDSDADGDALSVELLAGPTHGALVVQADGSFIYTPAAGFSGEDALQYRLSDGVLHSAPANVRLLVEASNHPPLAVADQAYTDEDSPINIDVLANDSDPDQDRLSVLSVTAPQHGSAVLNANGSVTYTPFADYFGDDHFSYTISDGHGGEDVGHVTVTMAPINDLPRAVDDAAAVAEDGSVLIDVRANDSDVDGDLLLLTAVSVPAHGTAIIEGGAIRYTPSANYFGSDQFSYTISDGQGSSTATVTVDVWPVDDAPRAQDDQATTNEDQSVLIAVLANDSDFDAAGLAIDSVSPATHGTVAIVGDSVRYTPAADHHGTDSFSYTLRDGKGRLATASVAISITPVDDAPTVTPQQFSTLEDTRLDARLVASDADADVLGFILDQAPLHGQLMLGADGHFEYRPDADFAGDDRFSFFVSDGVNSVPGQAAIVVGAVNDAPTLASVADQVLLEGQTLSLQLSASDLDGDPLSYHLSGGGGLLDQTGRFSFTALDGDALHSFTVQVSDGQSLAERSFTVNVANVAPSLVVSGSSSAAGGLPYTIQFAASDPGQDTINSWRVNWGDGHSDTLPGDATEASHLYARSGGTFHIEASASDEDGSHPAAPFSVVVSPDLLDVERFSPTASGFQVRFDHPFDASTIDLHGAAGGPVDVQLVGDLAGSVSGSLLLDADGRGFSFIRSGGILPFDSYSVRLASGPAGFHDSVSALDGNGDGIAGDDWLSRFDFRSTGAGILSAPDFMRGPGQPVDVPATGQRLPISFTSSGGLRSLVFTIDYDPRLLDITGATPAAGLPAGSDVRFESAPRDAGGQRARISVILPGQAALAAGSVRLIDLVARVPDSAPYGAKHVLDLSVESIDGGAPVAGNVVDDDALHLVGYLGDTSGDAAYTARWDGQTDPAPPGQARHRFRRLAERRPAAHRRHQRQRHADLARRQPRPAGGQLPHRRQQRSTGPRSRRSPPASDRSSFAGPDPHVDIPVDAIGRSRRSRHRAGAGSTPHCRPRVPAAPGRLTTPARFEAARRPPRLGHRRLSAGSSAASNPAGSSVDMSRLEALADGTRHRARHRPARSGSRRPARRQPDRSAVRPAERRPPDARMRRPAARRRRNRRPDKRGRPRRGGGCPRRASGRRHGGDASPGAAAKPGHRLAIAGCADCAESVRTRFARRQRGTGTERGHASGAGDRPRRQIHRTGSCQQGDRRRRQEQGLAEGLSGQCRAGANRVAKLGAQGHGTGGGSECDEQGSDALSRS
jgi:YD repeat-containing protein/VCBS repeat-containing protein